MKTYVWALYASLLLYSCGANSTNRQDAYSGGYPFSISGDIRSVPS